MKEYFNCLILTHGTAFGVGAAIFLLTLLLVARRVIGFTLSVVFMLAALGAAWVIDHEVLVRGYVDKWIPSQNTQPARGTPATSAPSSTPSSAVIAPEDSNSTTGSLKGQVEDQKARVQNFLEETNKGTQPTE